MSAPSDGARADARKARLGKLVSSDWDSLADWLGAMDEARNIFHITDEATTVINIDVEELAQRLAGVIADAKAEALREFAAWVATQRAFNGADDPGQALYDYRLNAVLPTWAQEFIEQESGR